MNHLPECLVEQCCAKDERLTMHMCICQQLRACEQRTLDAAREAVKNMCQQYPFIWPTENASMEALDAVIDALKEKP